MKSQRSRTQIILTLLLILFLLTTLACVCASEEELERFINDFINQLLKQIEQWLQKQWEAFLEGVKQKVRELWDDFLQWLDDQRKEAEGAWQDFWASIRPPAPTITAPANGITVDSGAVTVRGTALRESTLTLMRDGKHYRDVSVNAQGEWQAEGVVLNKGQNTFTAKTKKRLLYSPASEPVRITFSGGELGRVPVMSPPIDPSLNPYEWMVELALEQLKANGETFYEGRRAAFTAALRAGLEASEEDDEAHRFIDPDVPLTFNEYLQVLLVPKDAPDDQVLEALSKAVESAVLDEAVRQELMLQITESFERMDLTWVVEEGGETFTFEYVRIELDRTYLLEHFDPRAWAKLRTRLGTELVTGLLSEVSGSLVENAVKMGFALWGQADADSQAQHYHDLAVRAWNHRDIDGTLLRWDDPADNAFDGDMGHIFATNEEWAMFYLGRAAFYMQSPADPYYTIPYYQPKAELWASLAHKLAAKGAKALIEKKATAAFGKVLAGGAQPVTAVFTVAEIFSWMTPFLKYADAREVRDVHRPNFAEFTAGARFDHPMPEERQRAGAINERSGYPFRGPNDLMLHDYLQTVPLSIQERGEHPPSEFIVQPLLESKSHELSMGSWGMHDLHWVVRDIGERATQYVHSGRFYQTDKRIPEGDMIVDNPYLIREVFSYQLTDPPLGVLWTAEIGSHLQLVLLDGTVIEGRVDNRPAIQPVDYRYHNSQTLIENQVWVYVISLNELSYIAGTMDSFPYHSLDLIAVEGDEEHLYVVFDWMGGSPLDPGPSWGDLMYYLVGMAGNGGPPDDLPEKDGAGRIAADRLMVGTLATWHLLGRFAIEAPTYQPPKPIVVGPDDLGVALGSPAKLHLYDRRGRHVGPNLAGGVDLDIPGARYFTNPETGQQFIVIPHADLGDKYTVQVEGTGSGDFDLNLFYTDRRRRQAIRLAYDDVPLNPDTVAELAVRADDPHTLRVDDDGNGIFDQEMLPSRTIEVAVFALSRAPSIPGSVVVGVLLMALSAVGTWVVMRRRRHRQLAPAPIVQAQPTCVHCGAVGRPGARFCPRCGGPLVAASPALPVCAQCGAVAQRSGARFCPRCGGPLPAAASPRPQPRSVTRRRVSGRLMVALSALVVLLCFFQPWVNCSGLQASGWEIPGSFGTINFRGASSGPPGHVVYLVPLSAAVTLLLLRWSRRKIAGGLHILIGGGVLLFVSWVFLGGGALACSRWGLWGTAVGLVGIAWGGIKEMRE